MKRIFCIAILLYLYIRVSNRNSVARNCAKLCATVLELRGIARNYAKLRAIMRNYAKLRAIMRNCAQFLGVYKDTVFH